MLKALGFPRAARDIEKYNPDQPRVRAGSGRESGEWTLGGANGSGTAAESRLPRNVQVKPFVPQVVGGIVSDANPDGIVPGAQYAQASPVPVITAERIKHILDEHGPPAKDRKGEFYPEFANAESIRLLIEEAWAKATRIHVGAADQIDRVVLGGTVWFDDETGTHPLNIGRSATKLKTPSIETNTKAILEALFDKYGARFPRDEVFWMRSARSIIHGIETDPIGLEAKLIATAVQTAENFRITKFWSQPEKFWDNPPQLP